MLLSIKSWKFIAAAVLCAQSFSLMAADAAKAADVAKATEAAKTAAQQPTGGGSASSATINTESVISSLSAIERTRPFPVGEKLAYFVNIKDGDKVRSPF